MTPRGQRQLDIGALAILAGAAVTAYGAVQPWGPPSVDYGRDAVTTLAFGGILLVVGLVALAMDQ